MTKLKRPVAREVSREGRNLVVSLEPPRILSFREKGRRRRYRLDLAALFIHAVRNEVDMARAERRGKRRK